MRTLVTYVIAAAACAVTCGAQGFARAEPIYHYVSLDAALPVGFAFFDPVAVIDNGNVYGNVYRCRPGGCLSSVAVRRAGARAVSALRQGFASDANNKGVIAGSVLTNTSSRAVVTQAALFQGRQVQPIARRPGEVSSNALTLTDTGIALVESSSATDTSRYLLRRDGSVAPIDLGPDAGFSFAFDVNDRGVVSATTFSIPEGAFRGVRLRPPGAPTFLEPLATEPQAWGLGINSKGDVLGYSFVFGAIERIGFWRGTTFHTRFVEGTPEFPTVSNALRWNDRGLIVATATSDSNSYLIPRAGVRLNLADLADRLPPWTNIIDVNNGGDLVGVGGSAPGVIEEAFLLKRLPAPAATTEAQRVVWHAAEAPARAARLAAVANGLLPEPARALYRAPLRKDHRG